MAASDNSNDKLFGLLSYLLAPIVGIIILVSDSMKNNPVLKKHAVQSIALSVAIGIIFFVVSLVTFGFGGCLFPIFAIPAIIYGIQAYQGKDVTIPVVTDFCKKQGWI
jgi:uncharacterized membrane protein